MADPDETRGEELPQGAQALHSLFAPLHTSPEHETTPLTQPAGDAYGSIACALERQVPVGVPISDVAVANDPVKETTTDKHWLPAFQSFLFDLTKPTTWIGGFMFLLYHIVFSLTMGAAITRPHGVFGIVTKMSASGVMFASVVYWWTLGDDIPALYPAVDLFCAPFLANLAAVVDTTLHQDENIVSGDVRNEMFLATFTFLVCFGLIVTGILLMLSSVFKLANLGAFLPSPVLSGFFSAVGVLLWMLAVKVDTGGIGVDTLILSRDWNQLLFGLQHHLPSLVVAIAMKYLSPKSPFYVVGCIAGIVAVFYFYMGVAQVELQEMVESGWFWGKDDLLNPQKDFAVWAPPAPAGWINSLMKGQVHWRAVKEGMSTAIALAFLYMIRCSLHGSALRKNIGIMERYELVDESTESGKAAKKRESVGASFRQKQFSEVVDVQALFLTVRNVGDLDSPVADQDTSGMTRIKVQSKPTQHTLTYILEQYANSQFLCSLVGGFAITPSIGPSSTMYALGAESLAPQLISVIFLSIFFMTDFNLVVYIPKPAFSSVLILAFIDIMDGWFIKSFEKTRSKLEWMVNPFIVATAFGVGLLSAVFLGIAVSTFFFVASFYRSGVVKYSADGESIRSSIERPISVAYWLDSHGEMLQVLVLQSYLFFGNATSVLNFVSGLFENNDDDQSEDDDKFEDSQNSPKIVLLDFSLVPGMDGSAVDVLADILAVCKNRGAKLFLSGIAPPIRKTLQLGGVKPDPVSIPSAERALRLFPDLDSAVGKAEDHLIKQYYLPIHSYPGNRGPIGKQSGFLRALARIDEQHHTHFETDLAELGSHTQLVTLSAGEELFDNMRSAADRGLFFIEEGLLRIERSSNGTRSVGRLESSDTLNSHVPARRKVAPNPGEQTFRLARIGPGWVFGDHEALSGLVNTGLTIAVSTCRLHYISYSVLDEIERENPVLILKLYKLLSKLHALRSEVTIGQLATLRNIMSASPHNRPLFHRKPSQMM